MNENETRIKAIELVLWCIEQQDIYRALKTQGLSTADIAPIQSAVCEVYDDLQATKKLWEYNLHLNMILDNRFAENKNA